jgi:hypothetical protein
MVILVRDRKIQRHPITLGLRGLVMSEVVAGLKKVITSLPMQNQCLKMELVSE